MNSLPKVTVLMSVYNEINYVEQTIVSVLNQTYKNIEFIIVVDTTNDEIKNIIKKYLNDRRVKVFYNSLNIGLTKSLNLGIKEATGFYIARIDADDVCYLDRIEKQVKYMQRNPAVALLGTAAKKIDENDNFMCDLKCIKKYNIIKNMIFLKNCFIHPSVMYKKEAIDNLGGYDEGVKVGQDYNLWLRFVLTYKCENLNEPLIKYRVHKESITKKNNKLQKENGIISLIKIIGVYKLTKLQLTLLKIRVLSNISSLCRIN